MNVALHKFIQLIGLISIVMVGVAHAQESSVRMDRFSDQQLPLQEFEISYSFKHFEGLSGGSFQLKYDSTKITVVDKSNCLAGLRDSHKSGYSVCNVFPDKGVVQFIVLDVGRNRPVGDETLGSIVFVSNQSQFNDLHSLIELGDVRLAGPDGRHLSVPKETVNYISLSAQQK